MTPRTLLPVIFFDVGDTLVFDEPPLGERLRQALVASGVADPSAAQMTDALRVGERVALFHYLNGTDWAEEQAMRPATQAIVTALGGPPLTDGAWHVLRSAFLSVPFTRHAHAGAVELLGELYGRGHALGIISDWDGTLETVLTDCGLRPYFRTVTASHTVGRMKPHAAMFHDALRQMGAAPAEALHIGDWYELDAAGAQAVGMNALLFDHAGRCSEADCPRVTTFDALAAFLLAGPP